MVPGTTLVAAGLLFVGLALPAAQQDSGPIGRGRRSFSAEGCDKCHAVDGEGDKLGPDLSTEGNSGHSSQWLAEKIRNPKATNPQSAMPANQSLTNDQVIDLVLYMMSLTRGEATSQPSSQSAAVQRREEVFSSRGCGACHTVNGWGGTFGPDLSNEGNRGHSREWLASKIRDAKTTNPQSPMPAYGSLTDQEVNDLVDYMMSLAQAPPKPQAGSQQPQSPAGQRGQQLFSSQGCTACHAVNGQGGTLGPDLSNEGRSGHSNEWLAGKIRDPKSTNPQSSMPPYNSLTDQEVNDLVDYMMSLTQGPARPPAVEQGEKLFSSKGCAACHTVSGRGGKLGPDLSHIGERGYSVDRLKTKIRNPRTSAPNTLMPAYPSLREEQINDLVDYLKSLSGAQAATAAGRSSASRPVSP